MSKPRTQADLDATAPEYDYGAERYAQAAMDRDRLRWHYDERRDTAPDGRLLHPVTPPATPIKEKA